MRPSVPECNSRENHWCEGHHLWLGERGKQRDFSPTGYCLPSVCPHAWSTTTWALKLSKSKSFFEAVSTRYLATVIAKITNTHPVGLTGCSYCVKGFEDIFNHWHWPPWSWGRCQDLPIWPLRVGGRTQSLLARTTRWGMLRRNQEESSVVK